MRTIQETASALKSGSLTPTELVQETLQRIDEQDNAVQAYTTVIREQAFEDAEQAEREIQAGKYRGPLHGIPLAIKDMIAVKGVRLTAGSRVLDDFIAPEDATVIERLRQHGAIIVGKTSTFEFAYGPYSPPTRNPWKLSHTPGFSSSGSAAAMATGMALGALGTDTGGSIRIPAACCGVTGLKPTYGLVSCYGVLPLSWSLDHVGPLGRSAEDCALIFDAISVYDERDPASIARPRQKAQTMLSLMGTQAALNLRGLQLGVPQNAFVEPLDPEVLLAWQAALRLFSEAGAQIVEVDLPRANFEIYRTVQRPEATLTHMERGWLSTKSERYGASTLARLLKGQDITTLAYLRAQEQRRIFAGTLRQAMQPIDALVLPTMPIPAIPVEELYQEITIDGQLESSGDAMMRLVMPFNLAGIPAVAFPCGFNSSGLPLSLQVVGKPFEEGLILRIAHAYQGMTDWHLREPHVV